MKTFFVLSLVLTSIFPIHCFSCGRQGALVDASASMISDDEVMNEIITIMDDGRAEPTEVAALLESMNMDELTIEPNKCEYEFTFILMGIIGLTQQFFAENKQYAFVMTLYYLYNLTRSVNLYMTCMNGQ